jgi:site-specific DNA-adenine methylase
MQYGLFDSIVVPNKSIRLRVPYMGGKSKIALPLLREMLKVKPNAKYFYDLFGGGGSMSFTASEIGLITHYNELQTSLVEFIDYIFDRLKNGLIGQYGLFPDDIYDFIDRDEFMRLKDEDSIKGQFARICYSFGNNQRAYLFGQNIERQKHLGHNIVMFKCEKSLKQLNDLLGLDIKISDLPTWNERRLDFRRQVKDRKYKELERLERLERLQQLETLEHLERLEPVFTTSNLSYKDVKINTPIDETIIYLDPPYRNTAKYIEGKDFDYKELDQWFLDNKYTCFMSEYNAPHKVIFEIDKFSLLNNLKEKRVVAKEKLFWNNR